MKGINKLQYIIQYIIQYILTHKFYRVSIFDVPHLKKFCYLHNDALKYYCESCEEPVCNECNQFGPHNNKLHRVTNLNESFRKRFGQVNMLVSTNLTSKLEQLINQIQYIDHNIEQVKYSKNLIERNIRSDYSNLVETLR